MVAGPLYPESIDWPPRLRRIEHLPPQRHRAFYNSQKFTLNITRRDMVRAGYSPSVRLFEAAACGTPIISDCWPGLDEILEPGREILLSRSTDETLEILREMPESERRKIARRARRRVLAEHTSMNRASQLEQYALEVVDRPAAAVPIRGTARPVAQ